MDKYMGRAFFKNYSFAVILKLDNIGQIIFCIRVGEIEQSSGGRGLNFCGLLTSFNFNYYSYK